jgi:hypothetical protein
VAARAAEATLNSCDGPGGNGADIEECARKPGCVYDTQLDFCTDEDCAGQFSRDACAEFVGCHFRAGRCAYDGPGGGIGPFCSKFPDRCGPPPGDL